MNFTPQSVANGDQIPEESYNLHSLQIYEQESIHISSLGKLPQSY